MYGLTHGPITTIVLQPSLGHRLHVLGDTAVTVRWRQRWTNGVEYVHNIQVKCRFPVAEVSVDVVFVISIVASFVSHDVTLVTVIYTKRGHCNKQLVLVRFMMKNLWKYFIRYVPNYLLVCKRLILVAKLRKLDLYWLNVCVRLWNNIRVRICHNKENYNMFVYYFVTSNHTMGANLPSWR